MRFKDNKNANKNIGRMENMILFKKSTFNSFLLISFLSLLTLIFFASHSMAVPRLGVATDGTYLVDPGDNCEAYQAYFASGCEAGNGDNEGFVISPSGSDLHIFTNYLDKDIYLLTEYEIGLTNGPISFDGKELEVIPYVTEQADGYKSTPYYGLNLGPVDDTNWTLLPTDPFSNNHQDPFYVYTGMLEYNGSIKELSHIFAAADFDENGLLRFNSSNTIKCDSASCTDPFSPKTSSSVSVPEPSIILLLGSALCGVAIFRKKIS